MAATNCLAIQPIFHRLDILAYENRSRNPTAREAHFLAELNPAGWRRIIEDYAGTQLMSVAFLPVTLA
jgi:hypothetical protein